MVSDQTVAGLSIHASKLRDPTGISRRALHHKAKVNGDALTNLLSMTAGLLGAMSMMKLGSLADRAVGKVIGNGQHRGTNGLLAGFTDALMAHVTHPLVPQEKGLLTGQVTEAVGGCGWLRSRC